jgi:uncharacterized protein with HEPN domain
MSRSLKLYLDDILKSIEKIQTYTSDMTEADLLEDEKTLDAVIYNLQIIGEASKNIPENIRREQEQIEWKKIIGLRNIIAHTYFSLDYEILWDIIESNQLEELKTSIQLILKTENLEI